MIKNLMFVFVEYSYLVQVCNATIDAQRAL